MAITSGYVRINERGQPERLYHTQLDCGRSGNIPKSLPILEEDGILYTKYRGRRSEVRLCTRCGPPLNWDWQDDATCQGSWPPVDMIDIGQGKSPDPLIKQYCDLCPVQYECAVFALSRPEQTVGIWGGVHVPQGAVAHRQGIHALRVKHGILPDSADAA